MLPPALGGLRVCVPPVPGDDAPGSMSKITFRRVIPLERHHYTKNPPVGGGENWGCNRCREMGLRLWFHVANFRTAARMRSLASSQSNGISIFGMGIVSASTK